MSDSIKRRVPGGRIVTTAQAYCNGWRTYAEPIATLTGWAIHSFGHDHVKLVSPDYKNTQVIGLEFIEALFPVIRPKAIKCSRCNAPSSSVESSTPQTHGFVRSGDLLVPLDNVVELKSISPEPPAAETPVPEVAEEPALEEAIVRRRGRPRKNPIVQ